MRRAQSVRSSSRREYHGADSKGCQSDYSSGSNRRSGDHPRNYSKDEHCHPSQYPQFHETESDSDTAGDDRYDTSVGKRYIVREPEDTSFEESHRNSPPRGMVPDIQKIQRNGREKVRNLLNENGFVLSEALIAFHLKEVFIDAIGFSDIKLEGSGSINLRVQLLELENKAKDFFERANTTMARMRSFLVKTQDDGNCAARHMRMVLDGSDRRYCEKRILFSKSSIIEALHSIDEDVDATKHSLKSLLETAKTFNLRLSDTQRKNSKSIQTNKTKRGKAEAERKKREEELRLARQELEEKSSHRKTAEETFRKLEEERKTAEGELNELRDKRNRTILQEQQRANSERRSRDEAQAAASRQIAELFLEKDTREKKLNEALVQLDSLTAKLELTRDQLENIRTVPRDDVNGSWTVDQCEAPRYSSQFAIPAQYQQHSLDTELASTRRQLENTPTVQYDDVNRSRTAEPCAYEVPRNSSQFAIPAQMTKVVGVLNECVGWLAYDHCLMLEDAETLAAKVAGTVNHIGGGSDEERLKVAVNDAAYSLKMNVHCMRERAREKRQSFAHGLTDCMPFSSGGRRFKLQHTTRGSRNGVMVSNGGQVNEYPRSNSASRPPQPGDADWETPEEKAFRQDAGVKITKALTAYHERKKHEVLRQQKKTEKMERERREDEVRELEIREVMLIGEARLAKENVRDAERKHEECLNQIKERQIVFQPQTSFSNSLGALTSKLDEEIKQLEAKLKDAQRKCNDAEKGLEQPQDESLKKKCDKREMQLRGVANQESALKQKVMEDERQSQMFSSLVESLGRFGWVVDRSARNWNSVGEMFWSLAKSVDKTLMRGLTFIASGRQSVHEVTSLNESICESFQLMQEFIVLASLYSEINSKTIIPLLSSAPSLLVRTEEEREMLIHEVEEDRKKVDEIRTLQNERFPEIR